MTDADQVARDGASPAADAYSVDHMNPKTITDIISR